MFPGVLQHCEKRLDLIVCTQPGNPLRREPVQAMGRPHHQADGEIDFADASRDSHFMCWIADLRKRAKRHRNSAARGGPRPHDRASLQRAR